MAETEQTGMGGGASDTSETNEPRDAGEMTGGGANEISGATGGEGKGHNVGGGAGEDARDAGRSNAGDWDPSSAERGEGGGEVF